MGVDGLGEAEGGGVGLGTRDGEGVGDGLLLIVVRGVVGVIEEVEIAATGELEGAGVLLPPPQPATSARLRPVSNRAQTVITLRSLIIPDIWHPPRVGLNPAPC